jgi:hypothetical protein
VIRWLERAQAEHADAVFTLETATEHSFESYQMLELAGLIAPGELHQEPK